MFLKQSYLLPGGDAAQNTIELRLRRCRYEREALRKRYAKDTERHDLWAMLDSHLKRNENKLLSLLKRMAGKERVCKDEVFPI